MVPGLGNGAQYVSATAQHVEIADPLSGPGKYVYAVAVFTLRDDLISEVAIYYR